MASRARISRRTLLSAGVISCGASGEFLRAHASAPPAGTSGSPVQQMQLDSAAAAVESRNMHGGKGLIDVKFFFTPGQPARPALLVQYDIPPGASEGVHTHGADRPEGPWDEFYYIVSGRGRMAIDGHEVQVKAEDNVHTPLGVAHGIENASASEGLRVLLIAIRRD
jgi:quercetin dioxygenase-like cupin family protein